MKALKTKRRFVLLCVLTVLLALIIWTAWGNTALMVNTISAVFPVTEYLPDFLDIGSHKYQICTMQNLELEIQNCCRQFPKTHRTSS